MSEEKRTVPQTSHDAYNSVKGEVIDNHKSKILATLQEIETGTFDEICEHGGFQERISVSRRLSELEREEKIYKTCLQRPTRTGRNATVYAMVGNGLPKAAETKPKKVKKEKKENPVMSEENKQYVDGYFRRKKKNAGNQNFSPEQNFLF